MDAVKTPWHLWVIGVIGLLWNGFGAYDYLMTHLQGEPYLRSMGMTDPQIAYLHALPGWMTAAWAIGVWGALLATVLLLLRSQAAAMVFVLSLLGLVVTLVYQYGLTNGAEINGTQALVTSGVILAGCVLFAWYAWTMTKRGVLR